MSVLKKALGGLLKPMLRAAQIARVDEVADRFQKIDLVGDDVGALHCAPGDKVQVMIDGDFRTYSPFAFEEGRVSLLAFVHGDGPGARWARDARAGDTVHFFGPRGSLRLADLAAPAILVGDETSIGVARALAELGRPHQIVLEAGDVIATRAAAEAIGLREVAVVARTTAGDAHAAALWSHIAAAATTRSALVLTGNALTIQTLRRHAGRERFAFGAQKAKAYWAPGKRGLD